MIPFTGFGKIPRLSKSSVTITEKIDGTNAQIFIVNNAEQDLLNGWKPQYEKNKVAGNDEMSLFVGSRKRWITPGKDTDNYGFAAWVEERGDELIEFLGHGRHFGEWYGLGIGRNYGLDSKKLAMFNTGRWGEGKQELPDYLQAVPELYRGTMTGSSVEDIMVGLKERGSVLVPGFMKPEGVIVYQRAGDQYYKTTFENDKGKWTEEK